MGHRPNYVLLPRVTGPSPDEMPLLSKVAADGIEGRSMDAVTSMPPEPLHAAATRATRPNAISPAAQRPHGVSNAFKAAQ